MTRDFTFRGGGGVQPQYNLGVLMLEDCEGANNWSAVGDGADFVCAFTAAAAYFGGKGLDLRTRATGPLGGDYVAATRNLTLPESGRLVARGRVRFVDVSDVLLWQFMVIVFNGSRGYQLALRVNPNVPSAQYMNSAGGQTVIAGMGGTWTDGDWANWELSVDMGTGKYIGAALRGVRADLDGIAGFDTGASTDLRITAELDLDTAGAAQAQADNDSIYVGELNRL